jgi:prepilin-type N-terminal cleavage/methylation domain-containing protein
MKRDSRTELGFTLIEMMIALLMAAVIISPLYIVTKGLAERTTQQSMSVEAMQRARIALATISTDLSRTGLMTSANPATDPQSICSMSGVTCAAVNRRAVVHLNPLPNNISLDSIMITGNFFNARTYTATVLGPNTIETHVGTMDSDQECLGGQFNETYTYLHITGPSGKTYDAAMGSAPTWSNGRCTVTTPNAPPGGLGYSPGDIVQLEASHTLLYTTIQVAGGTQADQGMDRHKLVRCLVNYDGTSGTCPVQGLEVNKCVSQIEVVADYVTDFQVWFRPVTTNATTLAQRPNYYANNAFDGNTELTLDPALGGTPGNNHLFSTNINDTLQNTWLDCDSASPTFPANRVRSAMVRLSVRSTRPSFDYNTADFMSGGSVARVPRLSLSGAFEVRTVNTEVVMPNMIGR